MELMWLGSSWDLARIPFNATEPPACQGRPLGVSSAGGSFYFDPFDRTLVDSGVSPTVAILGSIGCGKSALAKTLIARSLGKDRSLLVIDPRDEYARLSCHEIARLDLGEIGAIDPFAGYSITEPDVARGIASLFKVATGKEVDADTVLAISVVARYLVALGRRPELVSVLDVVEDPGLVAGYGPPSLRKEIERSVAALGVELSRFANGDLAGLFSLTSRDESLPERVIVSLRSGYGKEAARLAASVLLKGRSVALMHGKVAPGMVVVDEAWSILAHDAAQTAFRELMKLSRPMGVATVLLSHRISDLGRLGSDLLSDAATFVLFRQPEFETANLAQGLGLGEQTAKLSTELGVGESIWLFGRRQYRVSIYLDPKDLEVTDTGGRFK
jgi:DNA helicase HerA-like ATPase